LVIWLLPKLWRLLRAIFTRIGQWLGFVEKPELAPNSEADSKNILEAQAVSEPSADLSAPTSGK